MATIDDHPDFKVTISEINKSYTDGIPQSKQTSPLRTNMEIDSVNANTLPIKYMRKKGLPWILTIFSVVIVILFLLLLCLVLINQNLVRIQEDAESNELKSWPAPNSGSVLAQFRNAAVVCDNGLCSEIGRNVLLRGGNAVDAAIATTICTGALNSHSSGIGGGFLMVIYNRFYGKCSTIDARETASFVTNRSTFVNNPENAFSGYKSVGVPGEVYGYWQAYKRYGSGNINWQDLFMPTIEHLTKGYRISRMMATTLYTHKEKIFAESSMKNFFVNPATGNLYKEGELMKNLQLAETLKRLASSYDPIRLFYTGDIAKQISQEFKANGFVFMFS